MGHYNDNFSPATDWNTFVGLEESRKPTGQNCLLCKRDLSFTPEGPIHQPAASPAIAVLPCGHAFHDHCLQKITPQDQSKSPPCIPCAIGETWSFSFFASPFWATARKQIDQKCFQTFEKEQSRTFRESLAGIGYDSWRHATCIDVEFLTELRIYVQNPCLLIHICSQLIKLGLMSLTSRDGTYVVSSVRCIVSIEKEFVILPAEYVKSILVHMPSFSLNPTTCLWA